MFLFKKSKSSARKGFPVAKSVTEPVVIAEKVEIETIKKPQPKKSRAKKAPKVEVVDNIEEKSEE